MFTTTKDRCDGVMNAIPWGPNPYYTRASLDTVHTLAMHHYRWLTDLALDRVSPTCPSWIRDRIIATGRRSRMRRAARYGVERYAEISTRHLDRDYRPGIGSGRTAHWHAPHFRRLQQAALAIHIATGLRGDALRVAAQDCTRAANIGLASRTNTAMLDIAQAAWAIADMVTS